MKPVDFIILCTIKGAYWQVDLEHDYEIARVDVFNRRDAEGDRLSNSVVELLHADQVVATYDINAANTAQKFTIPTHLFNPVSHPRCLLAMVSQNAPYPHSIHNSSVA